MQKICKIFLVLALTSAPVLSFGDKRTDSDLLLVAVKNVLKRYQIPQQSISLYVKDIDARQPWFTLNADTPRNPASTAKLITTLAALELLGPNYVWHTHFYLDGRLDKNTLYGNLVMSGGGDPYLIKEYFWHMLFSLRAKGLQHIEGDLLIDNKKFNTQYGHTGDFDNRPHRVYNVFPDAALLNFNAHEFNFIPRGNELHIYVDPPSSEIKIKNSVRLTRGRCLGRRSVKYAINEDQHPMLVAFSGTYPATCGSYSLLLSVSNSNEQYIHGVFKSLWEDMGGTIKGTVGTADFNSGEPFHIASSKPLSQIIVHINKYSNNVMARQLLLTIGEESRSRLGNNESDTTKILGRRAVKRWLSGIGISAPELFVDNGSGLSRTARVSATTLGRLLEHGYTSRYQPEFLASFPMVGVDGTVRDRLKDSVSMGDIRIKTGLLNGVRTAAGYVYSSNRELYIFVLLQSHPGLPHDTATRIQDEILQLVYKK